MEDMEDKVGFTARCSLCEESSIIYVDEFVDEQPNFCPMCGTEAQVERLQIIL